MLVVHFKYKTSTSIITCGFDDLVDGQGDEVFEVEGSGDLVGERTAGTLHLLPFPALVRLRRGVVADELLVLEGSLTILALWIIICWN